MKAPVSTALAVGLTAVIMIIALEVKHDNELNASFDLGTANGKAMAQLEIKESLKKKVTDNVCMAWWFDGDSKRVGEAIKKVKMQ